MGSYSTFGGLDLMEKTPQNPPEKNENDSQYSDPFEDECASLQKVIRYLRKEKNSTDDSISRLLYKIKRLSKFSNLSPDELIGVKKKKLNEIIEKFLYSYENKRTANSYKVGIKTFFKVNDRKDLHFPSFRLPGRSQIQSLPLSLEDAYKMAECAPSAQARFMIYLLISTGLRVSTMLSLRFGVVEIRKNPYLEKYTILREIENGEKNIVVVVFPEMKEKVSSACKGDIPYFTFMSEDASEALRDHMRLLEEKNGSIDEGDVLFPQTKKNKIVPNTPMSTNAVNKMLKDVAKKAGIPHWKLISAKAFRTLYKNVVKNQGKAAELEHEEREFLMGHILSKPGENYNCPSDVEQLRRKYSRIQFNPKYHNGAYEDLKHVAKYFHLDYDVVLNEAKMLFGKNLDKQQIEKVLDGFLQKRYQFTIRADQLDSYLQIGCRFVAKLDDGRLILEKDSKNERSYKIFNIDIN